MQHTWKNELESKPLKYQQIKDLTNAHKIELEFASTKALLRLYRNWWTVKLSFWYWETIFHKIIGLSWPAHLKSQSWWKCGKIFRKEYWRPGNFNLNQHLPSLMALTRNIKKNKFLALKNTKVSIISSKRIKNIYWPKIGESWKKKNKKKYSFFYYISLILYIVKWN